MPYKIKRKHYLHITSTSDLRRSATNKTFISSFIPGIVISTSRDTQHVRQAELYISY